MGTCCSLISVTRGECTELSDRSRIDPLVPYSRPFQKDVIDVSDWTNEKDSMKQQKRSNIIKIIIQSRDLDQLHTILGFDWDVNEILIIPQRHRADISAKWGQMTALHEAIVQEWTQGVKILLDAGAKCKVSGKPARYPVSPLTLALQNRYCPPEIIELLLKHGADPNYYHELNEDIPLFLSITSCSNGLFHCSKIVKLLLEYGADPNVTTSVPCEMGFYDAYGVWTGTRKERQYTCLYDAIRRGCTEVVKMLLDAGAKLTISSALHNPLALALHTYDCPVDLIELLLKHGADPNDHGHQFENVPLLKAIVNCENVKYQKVQVNIVQVLLEHGADPNVSMNHTVGTYGVPRKDCPLSLTIVQELEVFAHLFKSLLHFGADLNYVMNEAGSLLHGIMLGRFKFFKEQLDLFFQHGGNIHMEDGEHRTALECTSKNSRTNTVRWVLRHGAYTSGIKVSGFNCLHYSTQADTLLILLKSGMRVSHNTQTQLKNMEMVIMTRLNELDEIGPRSTLRIQMEPMWAQLKEAEEKELQRQQDNLRKSTFPEYFTHQAIDLQEFSDESLQLYPEDDPVYKESLRLQAFLRVLQFLSQPQSLQWYCRRCIRESLVSLQPSVVKCLLVPATLKRYILCHEL